jgi:hypothetical protein
MDDQRTNRGGGGMSFRKLRLQLVIVSTIAFVLLALVSLHEYRVSVSGAANIKQHAAWRLYASLSLITGLLALFLGLGRVHFSLLRILIATTLVAMVLGFVVYAARK